jgi:hypothetical protein
MVWNQPGKKKYYVVPLDSTAVDDTPYAVAKPLLVFGVTVNNVVTILGVFLTSVGTPPPLPAGYCVSAAGSDAVILIVILVEEPGAASNLASIFNVFELYAAYAFCVIKQIVV